MLFRHKGGIRVFGWLPEPREILESGRYSRVEYQKQDVGKDEIVKKWRIVIKGILFCLAILVIASCIPTPIVTILWEPDGNGFIQFQTNDEANASQGFLKLYPATDHGSMDLSFPLDVMVKKVLGSKGAAYGIVFCAANDQNYYQILIKTTAEYKISRIVPGGESKLQDWGYSNYLVAGYNKPNEITVDWTDPGTPSSTYFTVAFNGHTEYTSPIGLAFPGGQSGFVVYVNDALTEYFPTSNVDVRFQMLNPDTIPP